MSLKPENTEEESFIILGSSPGTSLDVKCNRLNGDASLDKSQIEDAMKDLSNEASMAFKAQFELGDGPSLASMMAASTIISEDKTTEELQKHFGELLDENIILKETLKQNNDSMKEQFLLIASCQEDMMKTHMIHKEKFDETRELIEKLRQENKKLKLDIAHLADQPPSSNVSASDKSGASSAVEFVSAPDDDTINKLTEQLALVEKQRRQIIVENENLTWQKESLEHIVDATHREKDELKEKLKKLELSFSAKEGEYVEEIHSLQATIQDLQNKLQTSSSIHSISTDEMKKRDAITTQLETKVTSLQNELKNAQLKILELENVKLEFSKYKSGAIETVKMYREQMQGLQNRIKEAQTTVFQPVRFSISTEKESDSEVAGYLSNVKLYDRAMKHLSELLNALTHGTSDSLVQTLGLIVSLQDFKLEKITAEQFRSGLADIKQLLERQHSSVLNNLGQVRSTMSIFEGIFKDYNEILKKTVEKQEAKTSSSCNIEALSAALVARGHELQALETEVKKLRGEKDDRDVLKAQLDLYKSDFEAERESREKMACEKENILTDLRTSKKRNEELQQQLDEVRKLNPVVYQNATTKRTRPAAGAANKPTTASGPSSINPTTGNMVYKCPKCLKFSSNQYKVMEDHFDFCLDDF